VDDDDVDIDYHIRHIILSDPHHGAGEYVGHCSSLLTEQAAVGVYVIRAYNQARCHLLKVHHAGLDGAPALRWRAVFDHTPQPREVKPPPARKRSHKYQLGVAELAGAALSNTIVQFVKIIKLLPDAGKVVARLVVPTKDAEGKRRLRLPKNWSLGPKTLLNVSITNQRAFAALSLSLAEAKQIAKRMDVTLNDVVLAVCSGALRRYLEYHGGLPKKSLIAGVPVSLREAGNTDMNNQVTMMLANLATNVTDPLERLRSIHNSTSEAKEFTGNIKAAIPMDFPSFGAPWLISGLASLYGRTKLADTIPPIVNVAISNVPGPQFPLYLAGAKMLTYYPVSIATHGVALNITVQSYNGSLERSHRLSPRVARRARSSRIHCRCTRGTEGGSPGS
jgi:WS/DGAT/MGAT family acyltransferase